MSSFVKKAAQQVVALLDTDPHMPILVFGNGGSASIANHMECDITKSTEGRYRVISLSANSCMLSAIANDLGYEETCSAQLRWRTPPGASVKYRLILISSSGSSPNIIQAAKVAKQLNYTVIGFSGNAKNSKGGELRKLSDLSIHSASQDYGVIEDFHSNVIHEMVRIMRQK